VEHDPLLKVGDQEILFLQRDTQTGKFFATGGGQGRFEVTERGAVTARNQESPVGQAHHGKRVEQLTEAVQAAR
jgi:tRNA(Phe) wybutosine-synthesizing methylase Tyw3